MNYRKRFIPWLLFLIFWFIQPALFGVGVEPLVVDLLAKPGDNVPFTINIIPTGRTEQVSLFLNQVKQVPNGNFSFGDADPQIVKWFSLPENATVTPEGPTPVKGFIKIPLNAAGGTYCLGIITETSPLNRQNQSGFYLRARFVTRINLRVYRPGLKPSVQVGEVGIFRSVTGQPEIRVSARNTSPVDFLTSATATLRDSQKKLVERLELKPQVSWDLRAVETMMFPSSELIYYGVPNKPIVSGEYELRLFYNYSSAGQIIRTKTIHVEAGDYAYAATKLKAVDISPAEVEFAGKPGTMSAKALKFLNQSDKTVIVTVDFLDLSPGYEYSILKNTQLECKGGKRFTIDSHRMAVNILNLDFPKTAVSQVNYGIAKVKVYSNDPDPILIEESNIMLAAAVGGKYTHAAKATNILSEKSGARYLLSAVIKNTGNIKLSPKALAMIKTNQGRQVELVDLAVEGDEQASVYPAKGITLTGYSEKLTPGKYKVSVKINEANENIGGSELDLTVK